MNATALFLNQAAVAALRQTIVSPKSGQTAASRPGSGSPRPGFGGLRSLRPIALLLLLTMSFLSGRLHAASPSSVWCVLEGRSGAAAGRRINLAAGQALSLHLPAGTYVVELGGEAAAYPENLAPHTGGSASVATGMRFRIYLGGQATQVIWSGGAWTRVSADAWTGPDGSDHDARDFSSFAGTHVANAHAAGSSAANEGFCGGTSAAASASSVVAGYVDSTSISGVIEFRGWAQGTSVNPCARWDAWAKCQGRFYASFTIPSAVDTIIVTDGGGDGGAGPFPTLPDQSTPAAPAGCEWQPTYAFHNAASGGWFALPASGPAIRFDALNTTRFTAISDFPQGQVWVEVGGQSYGPFAQGQSFSFSDQPGGSVTSFSVRSVSGPVPTLAAFQLALDAATGSFEAKIVGISDVRVELERLSQGLPPSMETPQFVARGETVRFAARVPGNCANSYQWRRNSVPIPGETGPTLTLTDLTPEQCGAFSVVVQNELGTAESPALTIQPLLYSLTVNAPGGTVERTPDQAGYEPGTVVTLQALPESGQIFAGWDGDVHSTANPLEITIDRNTTVNAWFGRPFGGTPRNVPGLIQAEDFDEGGEGVGYHDLEAENLGGSPYRTGGVDVFDGSSGRRIGWNAIGEWRRYTVNVLSAGWYRAVLRTSSGASGGTAQLRFSGGQMSDPIVVPGTGAWDAMSYTASALFALPAGIQVVQFDITQAGFDVDSFELVPVQSTPFGGTPWPVPGVIQAEDFDEGGEGSAYHDVDALNLGGSLYRSEGVDILSWAGGERVGWTANGEWLHYTVEVPAAGTYRAVLRAASGGSGGTARLRFSGGQQSELIVVPGTGSWDAMVDVTSAPFSLPAGIQVVQFDITQAGFDVDSFELQLVQPANRPPVANALAVTTPEDTALPVTLSAGDPDNDALTYAVVNAPVHGALSGTAPNLTYTPAANYYGPDSFTFTVNDGTVDSGIATVTITVNPVNDLPVTSSQHLSTPEDVALAVGLSASDVDGDTVTLSVISTPAHGTVSGTPPNLTYTPAANYHGSDQFGFKADDGHGGIVTATIFITVTSVNDAPVAVNDAYPLGEDMILSPITPAVGALKNDSDADGDTLTATLVTGPAHGTVTLQPDGRFTYTPTANFNGSDTFTYKVNDGTADSGIATVTITVNPANDAPLASAQSVTTAEDTVAAITLAGSDVDGDTLAYTVTSSPARGTLSGTAPNLSYRPWPHYHGPDQFTFQVSDGVATATATVTVTVSPVNDVPRANSVALTAAEDTALPIALSAADLEAGDYRVLQVFGTVTGAGRLPSGGLIEGADAMLYGTTEFGGAGDNGTVFRMNRDGSGYTVLHSFAANRSQGAWPRARLVAGPGGVLYGTTTTGGNNNSGTVWKLNPDGSGFAVLLHKVGFPGSSTGLLLGSEGVLYGTTVFGGAANAGTVFKVGTDGSGFALLHSFSGLANEGGRPYAQLVEDAAGALYGTTEVGGADAVNGGMVFKLQKNGTGFTVLQAFTGGTGNAGTLRRGLLLASDGALYGVTPSGGQNAKGTVFKVQRNGSGFQLLHQFAANGSQGGIPQATLVEDANGVLQGGTTAFGALGGGTIFRLNKDGTGFGVLHHFGAGAADGNQMQGELVVAGDGRLYGTTFVGAGPGSGVLFTLARAATGLAYTIATGPAHGTLSGPAPNLTYTPAANYQGADSFTFTVNDGTVDSAAATVSLAVTPVNDVPVISSQHLSTPEDVPLAVVLSATDVDGDTVTLSVISSPAHGTVSGNVPNLTYTPAANFNGSDFFGFLANDGHVGQVSATIYITVTPVNDAPVAVDDTYPLGEDMILSPITPAVGALKNDSDVDGDTLTAILVSNSSHGTVTLLPDGRFTYTPTANFNGPDTFTYKVNDGTTDSGIATVTITVNPANDAPVASAQSVTTAEDTVAAITLAGSDVDGDALTFAVVNGPAHGTLSGTAPNLTYRPFFGYAGPDQFSFRVNDGTADSEVATVSITVTPVNDFPEAFAQSVVTSEDTATAITLGASDPEAGGYTVLHTLTGNDGRESYGQLIEGDGGFLYGTTRLGGASGRGVVFRVAKDGTGYTVLRAFAGADGDQPNSGLTRGSDGLLYGTTVQGGAGLEGVVYRLATDGSQFEVIRQFTFPGGGARAPFAGVREGADGLLYGTTRSGGSGSVGTIYRLRRDGSDFTVLHALPADGSQGSYLTAGLVEGSANQWFGVAEAGGTAGAGVVFRVNHDGSSYIVLHHFGADAGDGQSPVGDLMVGPDGALYGTTFFGGDSGKGTVFKINPDGTDYTLLRAFTTTYVDAYHPERGALTLGPDGMLYGTTRSSGNFGAVYRISPSGSHYELLHDAQLNNGDGIQSRTGVHVDLNGHVFGITSRGGPTDQGVIFRLNPAAGGIVSYLVTTQPQHGTLAGTPPNLVYTPAANYSGTDRFTFQVSDGSLSSAVQVNITVLPVNDLPVAGAESVITAEDTPLAITLVGSDAEGNSLSYVVATAPAHGTLSGTGPNLTYTPAANYHGPDSFTFTVNDGTADSAPATVSITVTPVNDLPSADGQSLTTYDNETLAITLTGADVETASLTYRITSGPSAGSLSGTPPNVVYTPPFPFAGNDSFTFEVEDAGGATAQATVAIHILASDRTPVAMAGADQSVVAGTDCLATVAVDGSASSDADGDALRFTWQLLLNGGVLDTVTGQAAVSWSLPHGTYEAMLTVVTDKNGRLVSRSDSLVIQVLPSAPVLAALNPTGAYANGPGFNLTVTGGCFLPGAVVHWNNAPRTTTVVSSSELVAAIPASDLQTGVDIAVASIQVVNGDGQVSNPLGFSIVAQTVGTADAAVTQPGETSTVSTAPSTAGEPGVSVTVQNSGDQPVTVLAATYDTRPVGETAFQVDNGSFVDVQITGADENVSATVFFYYPSSTTGGMENRVKLRYFDGANWIPVLSSGGLPPAKDTTDNLDGTVSGGRFAVVFDATSTPTIMELTGTVFGMIESEPQLGALTGPIGPVALGNVVSVAVSFAVVGDPADAAVRFLWDDGTESTVTPQTTGSATAAHLYTVPGVYGVTVRVTDGQGDVREGRFEYVVIYDPNGGFVTGGGWIESLAGAYLFDPTLTGKATFGFNSKYLKGRSVPTGQTQFQFQAGDFKFHSTAYEWLVVSGAKAQYRGVGQVNGTGDYGFLLTATDGQLNGGGGFDKFRIKIWDRASGTVVYDNRRGTSDDVDAADPQAIGGGSIVIHKSK